MNKYKLVSHNSDAQKGWGDNDDTRDDLCLGRIYDGESEIHSWHTKIVINGKKYNGACFVEED